MSPETRATITLELLLDGDGLSGRAVDGGGESAEFSGRLGLMHAIDGLLGGDAGGADHERSAALGDGDHGKEQ
jgi:hypothetical protein